MPGHRHSYVGGLILITIGVLFLLDNLGYASFGDLVRTFWPVILIIIGLSIFMRRSDIFREAQKHPVDFEAKEPDSSAGTQWTSFHGVSSTSSDRISSSNTFGEVYLVLTSKCFQGGDVNTVFGEVDIDATNIELESGEQALRIHTVFGSTKVAVPKGIALRVTADTSFGDIRVMNAFKKGLFQDIDYSTEGYELAERKLRIIVSQVFGSLRVW